MKRTITTALVLAVVFAVALAVSQVTAGGVVFAATGDRDIYAGGNIVIYGSGRPGSLWISVDQGRGNITLPLSAPAPPYTYGNWAIVVRSGFDSVVVIYVWPAT